MTIATRADPGGTVLTLQGRFDAAAAGQLQDALREVDPERVVTIDFRDVRFIEDFALARLAGELSRLRPGRVSLVGLSEHQRRLLSYFGLGSGPWAARPAGMARAHATPIVLLVDEDPDLRAVLAEFLAREGYDVHEAGDVREAVRHTASHRPAVVLLDLAMPRASLVLQQFRESPELAGVPLVVISESDVAPPEACAMLEKPFGLDALVATLEKVLPSEGRSR